MNVNIFIKEREDLMDVMPQPLGNLHLSEGQTSFTQIKATKRFPPCAPWAACVSQSQLLLMHDTKERAEAGSAVMALSLAGSHTGKREA